MLSSYIRRGPKRQQDSTAGCAALDTHSQLAHIWTHSASLSRPAVYKLSPLALALPPGSDADATRPAHPRTSSYTLSHFPRLASLQAVCPPVHSSAGSRCLRLARPTDRLAPDLGSLSRLLFAFVHHFDPPSIPRMPWHNRRRTHWRVSFLTSLTLRRRFWPISEPEGSVRRTGAPPHSQRTATAKCAPIHLYPLIDTLLSPWFQSTPITTHTSPATPQPP